MKTVAQLLLTMTLAMIGIGVWVFAAGDRQTLVPPPDAVGASFLRQLSVRRYDRVQSYLSRSRKDWSPAALRRQFEPLWRYTGSVNRVEGEIVSIDRGRARAAATARGDAAEVRVLLELTREHGLWKVDGFSADPPLPPEPLR